MSPHRFEIGTQVMCNFGQHGWKLGRIVALDYREDAWPEDRVAPYQVMLDGSYALIYVPKDNDRFCRKATEEDVRIQGRTDALASLEKGRDGGGHEAAPTDANPLLVANPAEDDAQHQSYRMGRCFCCNDSPSTWLYAELYSEHYRCAARNGLTVRQQVLDLGTVSVGDMLDSSTQEPLLSRKGFLQAPMLARLPPGLSFSDEGHLSGEVAYDPGKPATYEVNFVAVSTADWADEAIGVVRLEMVFTVEGNEAPSDGDAAAFHRQQEKARTDAQELLTRLEGTWNQWERGQLGNRATCDRMLEDLNRLREVAMAHPRLDSGKWWGHLGGFHMNVHKLLENTLFECELYLGYALTFGDDNVRFYAEQNLKGCYQKRELEAARFMWYHGIENLLDDDWDAAIDVFQRASDMKEGWGWAVNYGDIWLSEAVAVMISGAHQNQTGASMEQNWVGRAGELINQAQVRSDKSGAFGKKGHPWVNELNASLLAYQKRASKGKSTEKWLNELKTRTLFWCSQVLGGVFPFPPKAAERAVSEAVLVDALQNL